MTIRTMRRTALAALTFVLIGAASSARAADATEGAASPAPPPPFARVYLALRGCTSCSHCRSAIRQMVRGSAKGGETRVDGGRVEIRYEKPRTIPLREVVSALAANRLHDLTLVDVLFEATGALAMESDSTSRFTMEGTGQVFRLSRSPELKTPAGDGRVRVVAVVEGWRERRDLTLRVREIKPES